MDNLIFDMIIRRSVAEWYCVWAGSVPRAGKLVNRVRFFPRNILAIRAAAVSIEVDR